MKDSQGMEAWKPGPAGDVCMHNLTVHSCKDMLAGGAHVRLVGKDVGRPVACIHVPLGSDVAGTAGDSAAKVVFSSVPLLLPPA